MQTETTGTILQGIKELTFLQKLRSKDYRLLLFPKKLERSGEYLAQVEGTQKSQKSIYPKLLRRIISEDTLAGRE